MDKTENDGRADKLGRKNRRVQPMAWPGTSTIVHVGYKKKVEVIGIGSVGSTCSFFISLRDVVFRWGLKVRVLFNLRLFEKFDHFDILWHLFSDNYVSLQNVIKENITRNSMECRSICHSTLSWRMKSDYPQA